MRLVILAVAMAAVLFGQDKARDAQQPEPVQRQPVIHSMTEGDKEITVSLIQRVGDFDIEIGTERVLNPSYESSGLVYRIKLPRELKKDEMVKFVPRPGTSSEPRRVDGRPPKPNLIELRTPTEGDSVVKGSLRSKPEKLKEVEVRVYGPDGSFLQSDRAAVTEDQSFSAGLNTSLAAGETIRAVVLDDKGRAISADALAVVKSADIYWGRFRSYFSVGAAVTSDQEIVKLDNSAFAVNAPRQTDLFVSLATDMSFYSRLKYCAPKSNPQGQQRLTTIQFLGAVSEKNPDCGKQRPAVFTSDNAGGSASPVDGQVSLKGWSWNTYFEARLAPAAANRYVPGLPTTNSVVLQMHPQSAVIEGGTYFPIVYDGTAWRFRGGQYAGFWAPLVKFGFQRVPARDKDLPDNLDVRGGNADWSYSGGLRLGIWGVPTDLDAEGPELLTYVDLTVGQWQNFRPWGCTELKNGGCAGSYRLYETGSYHRRFEATGRLRVPATPFTVGFTVNTGPGPDDVRFFFGSRFDLAKFLRAVVPPLSK